MTTTEPLEPSSEELDALEQEIEEEISEPTADFTDPLEDLFQEAARERKLRKPQKRIDPSLRDALDAATRRMREVYTNPDNWKRTRGLMLIDHLTHTVIGNYSEYVHRQIPSTRKLLIEHQPIAIDGQEEVEGFIGVELERKVRGITWDAERELVAHVLLEGLFAEAPEVALKACLQISTVVRLELAADTQFATPSGGLLLKLPAGTDIWSACSVDTKATVRRATA